MSQRKSGSAYAYAATVAVSLALATGYCSPSFAADGPPRKGGTLIFAIGIDPPSVNPVISTGIPEGSIGCVLYQGLTRTSYDDGTKPVLAKSWTISPDGKTYTFELEKAKWHDGKPFTSEDVKFSLLEVNAKYNAAFAAAGRAIDTIDTPTPDRAVIHLKQPFGPLLLSLGCSLGGAILPAHIFQGSNILQNPANSTGAIGTGAFKLSEWKRGDYIRLGRNPDYWEAGKPYLDEVVGKVIGQPSSRTQALLAGEIDYISEYYLGPNDYPQVKANPNLDSFPANGSPTLNLMFLNLSRKPWNDARARKALFMGTDREFLVKNAYLAGGVGTMPFTNRIPWAADTSIDYRTMYPYDVAKANALFDEIGLKRGADGMRFKFDLVYPADDVAPPLVAAALKSMWRAIGVDMNNLATERAAANQKMFIDRDFDGILTGYTSYGDPALGLARIWVTSSIGKLYGNAGGYSNPEVDALFAQGEQTTGEEARGAIYRKLQGILAAELPVFTLNEKAFSDGRSIKVKGPREDMYFFNTWREVWLDR